MRLRACVCASLKITDTILCKGELLCINIDQIFVIDSILILFSFKLRGYVTHVNTLHGKSDRLARGLRLNSKMFFCFFLMKSVSRHPTI